MMDISLYKAIRLCQDYIGFKDTTTDKEIAEVIDKFKLLFPDVDTTTLKRELLDRYTLPMEEYKILLDNINPGKGWLSNNNWERRRKGEWRFWERYKSYLGQSYAPGVIYQLDRLTDDILDNLFDPLDTQYNYQKRGLVVGQVQSGKTSNFTGLICKAVDSGFNVIIVFAGILDDLRYQTQSRLEKCFLGFTTKDIKKISDRQELIGVGKIDRRPIAHAFTTVVSDFKVTTINSLGANFQTKEPIMFVVKKNGSILKNLIVWLSKKDRSEKKVLFIDDEADNASVNTKKELKKASTINERIRDLLDMFKNHAYVGYTATPYANIFIDSKNTNDLFPRHFIINIPTPPAYLGPERVFGIANSDEKALPLVTEVCDYAQFVPDKHKKDEMDSVTYANLPESLKYAVRCFILSCAVRCARGQNEHNSMLIHISRYQCWQNQIKDVIIKLFDYYRNEIKSDDPSTFDLLKKEYENGTELSNGVTKYHTYSYPSVTKQILDSKYDVLKKGLNILDWESVKGILYYVVDKIEVKALNGASSDVLAYDEHKKDGYYVIAIGGDKLSRGLTLEGLTVSYFLRASKMYDTLMQMGRWFGYRLGYVDTCRLFISPEINRWFKEITIANNELRSEFDYLYSINGSPQQYSLRVRTSPGLLITSPLKMQATKDIQVSWASTLVETYSLIRSRAIRDNNFTTTKKLIKAMGTPVVTGDKINHLWINISPNLICKFINDFEIAPTSRIKMDFEKMVKYIKKSNSEYGELDSWRVIVRNSEKPAAEDAHYDLGTNICGTCTLRTKADDSDYEYNIKNYHLISGPQDEFLDMNPLGETDLLDKALIETKRLRAEEIKRNPKIKPWEHDYPHPTVVRKSFRSPHHPLLIIYPLNPIGANGTGMTFKNTEDPFMSFAIVFPSSKNPDGYGYKVNNVKDSLIESEQTFESENDNSYEE